MKRKQKNKKAYKEKRAAHLAKKRAERALFQIEGKVQMTREGYCFVTPVSLDIPGLKDREVGEIFVKATRTRGALNGDRVVVSVTKKKAEGRSGQLRYEGVITQIVERSPRPFVGLDRKSVV